MIPDLLMLLWSQDFPKDWKSLTRKQKNDWYDFKSDMWNDCPELYGYQQTLQDDGTSQLTDTDNDSAYADLIFKCC